jgi:hypothetical protein
MFTIGRRGLRTPTGSVAPAAPGRKAGGRTGGRIARVVLGVILVAYALAAVVDLALHVERYQWDFATYYRAGQAARAGLNPYELDSLTEVAGTEVGFPFAYSPIVLPVFSLLSRLEFIWAYRLYLGLKVVSLGVLLVLWKVRFLDRDAGLPFYLVCIFGFGGAIYADLAAGNVSIFEQLALWLGFEALRRNRPILFSALVIAASLFKLTPILFLLLLVAPGLPRRTGVLVAALGAFVVVNGLTYLAAPGLYRDFLSVAPQLDDRGAINPSTLALLRDLGDVLARKGLPVPEAVEWGVYAAFAGGVTLVTGLALRRRGGEDSRFPILLACLAFALVMPRFKNYAYILLLPPAYFVLRRMVEAGAGSLGLILLLLSQTPPAPFGLGEAIGNLFWGYYPWLLALGLWAAAVAWLLRGSAGAPRRAELLGVQEGGA